MSQFDYTKKLDIYAPMVLQFLLHIDEQGGALKSSDKSDTQKLGVGYIEAIDGENYLLNIQSTNFQKFKKIVDKGSWGELSQFVRNKSNQFPVKNKRRTKLSSWNVKLERNTERSFYFHKGKNKHQTTREDKFTNL
jgi:hypothetical protein